MRNNPKHILSESDLVLKEIISEVPQPKIESTNNVFHDLMSCILEQQIHYRSTKKIFQKMLGAASIKILTPENFYQSEESAFPTVSLSLSKRETALRIVEFWNENRIKWDTLPDDEVREKLSSIKGVGNWSIDMILLYTLQRPNIFPSDDFHLKQIMAKLYGLNPKSKLKAQMKEVSENWAEHKSLAVRYLLAWKGTQKTNE